MIIKLNIPNEKMYKNILSFLTNFKKDGLEIITYKDSFKDKSNRLEQFENIINHQSKNSIKIDKSIILNPANELTNDIS